MDVDLHPSLDMVGIAEGECEVGIRCGIPPWPGLKSELLLPIHLSPLCTPALLEGRHPVNRPADLRRHKLIHADVAGHVRGEEWDIWLAAAGEHGLEGGKGLHFREPALALQAAADGLGVCMGYLEFVQEELRSGRLVQPFDLIVRHPFSYYLVTRKGRPPVDDARVFAAWIRREAKTSLKTVALMPAS